MDIFSRLLDFNFTSASFDQNICFGHGTRVCTLLWLCWYRMHLSVKLPRQSEDCAIKAKSWSVPGYHHCLHPPSQYWQPMSCSQACGRKCFGIILLIFVIFASITVPNLDYCKAAFLQKMILDSVFLILSSGVRKLGKSELRVIMA